MQSKLHKPHPYVEHIELDKTSGDHAAKLLNKSVANTCFPLNNYRVAFDSTRTGALGISHDEFLFYLYTRPTI